MKGLLLKDAYMTAKYCRAFVLIIIVFVGVSFLDVDSNQYFFTFYPCILSGMIPITLLGYDERSGWMTYSATFPYSKAQIVSGKYIIGLLSQASVLIVICIAQAIKMSISKNLALADFGLVAAVMLVTSCVTSGISLPFMFKLGVEKGRIAFYFMIGSACAASVIAARIFDTGAEPVDVPTFVFPVLLLVGIVVYAGSWLLSIRFFDKCEIH